MLILFQVCFFVGIGLTVLSLLLGNLDFDGFDLDIGGGDATGILVINSIVLITFITVFGGSGIVLYQYSSLPKVLVVISSLLLACLLAFLMSYFIIRPLKKAEGEGAPGEEDLIGLLAKVTEQIQVDGFGEIAYSIHDNTFLAPAKSVDGSSIKKGEEVAICWIKEYVFYVKSING